MSKGIYCLVLALRKDVKIPVGIRKKEYEFPKGFYCYVGSGMKSLESRIHRHQSKNKKKFWNIDYFLDYADIVAVKTIQTNKKIECKVSNIVKSVSEDRHIKGFGSSDCKCPTHLHYFKDSPLENDKFISVFDLRIVK
ncbi:MAG: GIY-YIG nuclease family protein [Nanoarchaeota archaeon]|nr:GIY-YIG nuclease family protein [Nanoarchaeota archaeon]MBU1135044.1 GIY-YIG nuclease family protein [Nanoarchaeota archaeon]MBU2520330.1 GIY-YIG nuclease family protein [Nanoarchaeota archaeon]